MDDFRKKYKEVFQDVAGTHGTIESEFYCKNIELKIDNAVQALEKETSRLQNVNIHYQKGWLAEQWHAETFKIDGAARSNESAWAYVPGNNRTGEDIIYGGESFYKTAELKYYRDGSDTAKAISRPDYIDKEKIVPSDQLSEVRKSAQKEADKLRSYRPNQSENYQDTANRADDRIRVDDVSSKPLNESKAKELAKDFKKAKKIDPDKYGLNSENYVEWSDIARESGKAAMHAAVLSAAIQVAPHVYNLLDEILTTGDIDISNLENNGLSVLKGTSTAALRGGVAAAITASCKTGLLGTFLKSASPSAIGMATTMVLNSIDYSIKLYKNEIPKHQFANFCIKDSLILTTALTGASIGQLVIPFPLLGALVGNIIGGIIGNIVYERGNGMMLGLGVENGWTFFGLVQQNFTMSEEVLKYTGYNIFESTTFMPEAYEINNFETNHFKLNEFQLNCLSGHSIAFTPLSRGVIGVNVVGYV